MNPTGPSTLKLNIFSWTHHIPEFANVDIDPVVEPQYVADARSLPFTDGSVEEIYIGHGLEHVSHEDVHKVLAECVRVLKANGKIAVTVPDTETVLKMFNEGTASLALVNSVVFGHAENRAAQDHLSVFNTKILLDYLTRYFRNVEVVGHSPYLYASVPWQTIAVGIK